MRLLAIDPGGKMGVAWHPGEGRISPLRAETWDLERIADPGQRYRLLLEMLDDHRRMDRLVWETSPRPQGAWRRWYYAYLAIAELWCSEHGTEFLEVQPSTIKEYATGDRRAPKVPMRHAAAVFFRAEGLRDPKLYSEHQIDALWLLAWAVSLEDQSPPLRAAARG